MASHELLRFLAENRLPQTTRLNVSPVPVSSITVGCTPRRRGGLGISSATSLYRGRVTRLLLGLLRDPSLGGERPSHFTSMCLNVGYAAGPHVDRYNSGPSFVVGLGNYEGGELFVQDGRGTAEWKGVKGLGTLCDIRQTFVRFSGSCVHAVKAFSGNRVSVVYFSVPLERCKDDCAAHLAALGFPVYDPRCSQALQPALASPGFRIFICSSRRASGVSKDTLNALFSDGSLPPQCVTMCLRDEVDREDYRHLPLHTIMCSRAGTPPEHTGDDRGGVTGLPEQRAACLRYAPPGSWLLFVDDDVRGFTFLSRPDVTDVTDVTTASECARTHPSEADDPIGYAEEGRAYHRSEEPTAGQTGVCAPTLARMSLRDLILFGFLASQNAKVRLWGLNTSSATRNLRDNISYRPGLVNGYFFGVIRAEAEEPALILSNAEHGAGEDIERSLRYCATEGGVLRLNFATVLARVRSNAGGLQSTFASPSDRLAAHGRVLAKLYAELPQLIELADHSPNGCRFLNPRRIAPPQLSPELSREVSRELGLRDDDASDPLTPTDGDDVSGADVDDSTPPLAVTQVPQIPQIPQIRRREDRAYHRRETQTTHENADVRSGGITPFDRQASSYSCSQCAKCYTRKAGLDHHKATAHSICEVARVPCPLCGRAFLKKKDAMTHWRAKRCNAKRGKYSPVYIPQIDAGAST
jgi:hypothetical protein